MAHPQEREVTRKRLVMAYDSGGQDTLVLESETIGRELGAKYLQEYAANASDESIQEFFRLFIEILEYGYRHDAEACYQFMFGDRPKAATDSFPSGYMDRMDQVTVEIISEAASGTGKQLSEMEREAAFPKIQEITRRVLSGPDSKNMYLGGALYQAEVTPEQKKGACLFALRLYQAITAESSDDQTAIYKTILSTAPVIGPPIIK